MRGVVAASAGNHALGVAHACLATGIRDAHVFVQNSASQSKIAKLRDYDVHLHLVGDTFEETQQAALARAGETGAVFISPYDHPHIIAGQGTCALEILDELPDCDAIIVPAGGGALIAGVAVAAKAANPNIRIIGVNPTSSPSALLSLERGYAVDPYDHAPTLATGLAGGFGRYPFLVARDLIERIVLVSEDQMRQAIVELMRTDNIIAEPSGIVAVAAALYHQHALKLTGKTALIVSGGNIDDAELKVIMEAAEGGQ